MKMVTKIALEDVLPKQHQGAKKIIFAACHSGKLKLAFTSPEVISTSPKNFLTSRIDFTVLLLFEFLKKHHLPVGQVENRIHQPDSKIHQPRAIGLVDFTFFLTFFAILSLQAEHLFISGLSQTSLCFHDMTIVMFHKCLSVKTRQRKAKLSDQTESSCRLLFGPPTFAF